MSGVPVGLDFGAIMAVAGPMGADLEMLSEALPDLESAILSAMAGDESED